MSFNASINNVFLNSMKSFLDTNVNTESNSETIYEDLKGFLNISVSVPDKKSKNTVKRVKKLPNAEDRCLALKVDSLQCKGQRQKTGTEPTFCTIHNKTGAKNGLFNESIIEGEISESEIETEFIPPTIISQEKVKTKSKKTKEPINVNSVVEEDFA